MNLPLKKCPFCGATAKIGRVKGNKDLWELWANHNNDCLLYPYHRPVSFDRDALTRKWNMRKGEEKKIYDD